MASANPIIASILRGQDSELLLSSGTQRSAVMVGVGVVVAVVVVGLQVVVLVAEKT